MKLVQVSSFWCVVFVVGFLTADEPQSAVKEKQVGSSQGISVKVRMQGPYDMDTPLQIVCYFRHKPEGDKTLGAAVELDKRLHGVIASLRNRGEFPGEESETLLLTPPSNTITPKQLLLIGLGDEETLSLERIEVIGRVAFREASRLGAKRVAFAPLIRDQGNAKFPAGDIANRILKAALLAHDTEVRLQKEGLGRECPIEEWVIEAGPQYFDETVTNAQAAIESAKAEIAKRPNSKYSKSD